MAGFKQRLACLLKRRPNGIFLAPFEQGRDRFDLFRAACSWGLEGLESKRADRPCRGGRSKDWAKVQGPKASGLPAGGGSVLDCGVYS